ncbi:MAG: PRC-barrel domain-containing protein [Nitrospira sp.]|nr:PRC-barrel domain-containing protein [Nitrospira sp.]
MKQFRRVQDITKLTLRSIDGQVGTIRGLYFDDQNWAVRYLVVRTGRWLMGRHVLITPIVIGTIDDADASIRINLHKGQIEHAPSIKSAESIPRRYEQTYYERFQWTPYWQPDTTMWGSPIPFPDASTTGLEEFLLGETPEQSHLRSSAAVTGCGIRAQDGESVIWRISSSTMKIGSSGMLRSIRGTGCLARRSWCRPDESDRSTGTVDRLPWR